MSVYTARGSHSNKNASIIRKRTPTDESKVELSSVGDKLEIRR